MLEHRQQIFPAIRCRVVDDRSPPISGHLDVVDPPTIRAYTVFLVNAANLADRDEDQTLRAGFGRAGEGRVCGDVAVVSMSEL
jgi:hypothetical protein